MWVLIFWTIAAIAKASEEVRKVEKDQQWQGFSIFLHVLLPAAGLALLWRQRSIFSKLLLQLDKTCVSVYCPSLSRREKLLKWASSRLPSTWSSQARTLSSGIPELWKDGSLLCTLINSVVPGACPSPHRHWRKPPLHAQALAYKYLGLAPMFTDDELCADFTINQERNFIHYLQKLQEAINRWPTREDTGRSYSTQYVARGMGLYTGEQHRKTIFYVYSDTSAKKRGNVLLYIRGPYGTHGKAIISPFHNLKTIPVVNVLRDQLEATKTIPFKSNEQKSFLKTISLDFTSLISNTEEKNDSDDIPIQIDMEIDRAKVTYIPQNTGIYEINLISDGELLRGSPYNVRVIHNTSERQDSFNSDSENVEEKITFTKRKILSKVIDCVDEKICINNGRVSKIKLTKEKNATDSESDVTITAITKKKDEILKTEINCTLENIIEEINTVQDGEEKALKENTKEDALEEIKKIAKNLKDEVPQIVDSNLDEEKEVNLKVDSQYKLVKSSDEAKTEIINFLKQEREEIDGKYEQPMYNFDIDDKKLITKLDINLVESTKYLKNIVNTTSRQEMLDKIISKKSEEDENNNSSPQRPLKRITSKIYFEITPKNVSVKTDTSFNSQELASPICPDHIVPEVEKSSLNQLSLAEKRKVFAKQNTVSDSDNFTFSITENESSKSRDSTFRELSVLNVLDSLRQSRKNSLSDSGTLSSATSLPNMTSLESNYENNLNDFKARKDYWERLSSRSSSSLSVANSDYSPKKNVTNKNVFNKFNISEKTLKHNTDKTEVVTFSVDNLLSTKRDNFEDRKIKSVDTSLEDCTLVSIEDRKKQLLKNLYEEEKRISKKLNLKHFFKKDNKPKVKTVDTFFTPISVRIHNFDSQSKPKSKLTNLVTKQVSAPTIVNDEPKKTPTKSTIKSQFKRAIKFFKNLEENSKTTEKKRNKDNFDKRRRFSLDFQKKNNHKVKESGSLKLPCVSDRFSVDNLYEDVFGNNNGSFRGPPNKRAVASSLASLVKNLDPSDIRIDENNISYNLFVNKSKNKKRKSIKTFFDVNY